MSRKSIIGKGIVALGICFIIAAGFVAVQNELIEKNAEDFNATMLSQVEMQIQVESQVLSYAQVGSTTVTQSEGTVTTTTITTDDGEEIYVPQVVVDNREYVGVLSIPAISITIPVQTSWSYAKLFDTPCVFEGSIAQGNLIIAGHNYRAHFSQLSQLAIGNEVTLKDATGVTHYYTVTAKESIHENYVDDLRAGEWDLTLFTCDFDNNSVRTVIRLTEIVL